MPLYFYTSEKHFHICKSVFQAEMLQSFSKSIIQAYKIKMHYLCQTQQNHCLFIFKVIIKKINDTSG